MRRQISHVMYDFSRIRGDSLILIICYALLLQDQLREETIGFAIELKYFAKSNAHFVQNRRFPIFQFADGHNQDTSFQIIRADDANPRKSRLCRSDNTV